MALALLLALGAPAASAQLLAPADAEELAQSLAEATAEQGVCYGWAVRIDDENGSLALDAGSSLGPLRPLDRADATCRKYVELTGLVDYTSETSESEDSASYSIESNLANPPTTRELRDLGHGPDRLLEEDDDEALANAVGALPLLVADHGEAPAVGFEAGSDLPPEQQGAPTGDPGSDALREHGALFALSLLALLGGIAWLVLALTGKARGTARWIGKQMTD
jgi:hypothetical protein